MRSKDMHTPYHMQATLLISIALRDTNSGSMTFHGQFMYFFSSLSLTSKILDMMQVLGVHMLLRRKQAILEDFDLFVKSKPGRQ